MAAKCAAPNLLAVDVNGALDDVLEELDYQPDDELSVLLRRLGGCLLSRSDYLMLKTSPHQPRCALAPTRQY